jgi:hypothetical protein
MKQNQFKSAKAASTSVLKPNLPHSKDGVDLSLIQWMLSFTPTERLQILQNTIRSIIKLRGDQSNT